MGLGIDRLTMLLAGVTQHPRGDPVSHPQARGLTVPTQSTSTHEGSSRDDPLVCSVTSVLVRRPVAATSVHRRRRGHRVDPAVGAEVLHRGPRLAGHGDREGRRTAQRAARRRHRLDDRRASRRSSTFLGKITSPRPRPRSHAIKDAGAPSSTNGAKISGNVRDRASRPSAGHLRRRRRRKPRSCRRPRPTAFASKGTEIGTDISDSRRRSSAASFSAVDKPRQGQEARARGAEAAPACAFLYQST